MKYLSYRKILCSILLISSFSLLSYAEDYNCLDDPEVTSPNDHNGYEEHMAYGDHTFWKLSCTNESLCKGVKDSYILGTMHIPVKGFSPSVMMPLSLSKKIITEIDPSAKKEDGSSELDSYWDQAFYSDDNVDEKGWSIANYLTTDEFKELKIILKPYLKGFATTEEQLLKLKPWAMSNIISRPISKAPIMDQVIMTLAKKSGSKKFVALETMTDQVKTLTDLPLQDQEIMLKSAINDFAEGRKALKVLEKLYQEQNLAGIRICDVKSYIGDSIFVELMESTVYKRNETMAAGIYQNIMDEYKVKSNISAPAKKYKGNVFIAIGANHLPGDRGVLKILEKQGFTITPVEM